jgi:hypothetical protein
LAHIAAFREALTSDAAVKRQMEAVQRRVGAVESWPRAGGSRMIVCGVKTGLGHEKMAVEVRRKSSPLADFAAEWRILTEKHAELMTRAIEIGCSTWVSWDVYRAGAQSMGSNGKSRSGEGGVHSGAGFCLTHSEGPEQTVGQGCCGGIIRLRVMCGFRGLSALSGVSVERWEGGGQVDPIPVSMRVGGSRCAQTAFLTGFWGPLAEPTNRMRLAAGQQDRSKPKDCEKCGLFIRNAD